MQLPKCGWTDLIDTVHYFLLPFLASFLPRQNSKINVIKWWSSVMRLHCPQVAKRNNSLYIRNNGSHCYSSSLHKLTSITFPILFESKSFCLYMTLETLKIFITSNREEWRLGVKNKAFGIFLLDFQDWILKEIAAVQLPRISMMHINPNYQLKFETRTTVCEW